jgi:hypothetical protein
LQPRYENSVAKPLSDFTTPAYQKTACMRRHKAISQAVRLKTTRNTCFGTTSILAPPCKMAMKVSPMNRRFPERHTEQMRQDVHQQLMPVGRKAGRTEPIYGKPVFQLADRTFGHIAPLRVKALVDVTRVAGQVGQTAQQRSNAPTSATGMPFSLCPLPNDLCRFHRSRRNPTTSCGTRQIASF